MPLSPSIPAVGLVVVLAALLTFAALRLRRLPEGSSQDKLARVVPALVIVGAFLAFSMVPMFLNPPRPLEPVPFVFRVTAALCFVVLAMPLSLGLARSRQTLLMSLALSLGLGASMLGQMGDTFVEAVNAQQVRSVRTYRTEFQNLDEHRVRKSRSSFYLVVRPLTASPYDTLGAQRLLISVFLHGALQRELSSGPGRTPRTGQLIDVTEATGWLGLTYVESVKLAQDAR